MAPTVSLAASYRLSLRVSHSGRPPGVIGYLGPHAVLRECAIPIVVMQLEDRAPAFPRRLHGHFVDEEPETIVAGPRAPGALALIGSILATHGPCGSGGDSLRRGERHGAGEAGRLRPRKREVARRRMGEGAAYCRPVGACSDDRVRSITSLLLAVLVCPHPHGNVPCVVNPDEQQEDRYRADTVE